MQKAIKKARAIKKTVLVYQNNPSLSYRSAVKIYEVSAQSVIRYYNGEITPVPDIFITSQKLSPVEEAVLIEHSVKCWKQGFPLTIRNLNDFANKLLRNRGANQEVGVNWHLAFFKRHPEVRSRFSRTINKQRVFAENLDTFIKWFRRFHETRIK